MDMSFFGGAMIASLLLIFLTVMFLAKSYRRCPSNKILVVYGRVGGSKTAQFTQGNGRFVWPIIQGYAFLDLTPRTINIYLNGALSHQNIRVNVPSTFTIAVGLTAEIMNNAAARLLDLDPKQIESMATEIIIGQLRFIIASLRIEDLNEDREYFLDSIKQNIEPELHKLGLTLLNVNITDITDESDYIESIGKKASSTAVNRAKVDVAEQEKQGDIGKALAERDRRVSVASFNAEALKKESESKAQIALINATLAEKEAEASQRSEVAKQNAEAEIQKARALAQAKRLEAEVIVPEEIKKKRAQIEAEAEAQSRILVARGEAEAILTLEQAEAEGIQMLLDAKANGYRQLIEACGNDVKNASTMLFIEKLEEIVKLQAEANKNNDRVAEWENENEGELNRGSLTSNFISEFVKSLPAFHDVASLAGLKMPQYHSKPTK
jgi:flotillin